MCRSTSAHDVKASSPATVRTCRSVEPSGTGFPCLKKDRCILAALICTIAEKHREAEQRRAAKGSDADLSPNVRDRDANSVEQSQSRRVEEIFEGGGTRRGSLPPLEPPARVRSV